MEKIISWITPRLLKVSMGLGCALFLLSISGCMLPGAPSIDIEEDVCDVDRIGSLAKIYRPLIGSGDDWHVEPRERTLLMFATGRDQYGNATGLSDDSVWSIAGVTLQCGLQTTSDTTFNPPYERDHFWADGHENACIWYPTWAGKIEQMSGRPFSPYPEVGYPFNPCWSDFCDVQSPSDKAYIPPQMATITARATAKYMRVRVTCPNHREGEYALVMPGTTPQSSNVFDYTFGQPDDYEIVWKDGEEIEVYSFLIPTEWFWISGSWSIEVDAQVTCKIKTP